MPIVPLPSSAFDESRSGSTFAATRGYHLPLTINIQAQVLPERMRSLVQRNRLSSPLDLREPLNLALGAMVGIVLGTMAGGAGAKLAVRRSTAA